MVASMNSRHRSLTSIAAPMAILTALYLTVEIPFGALLLDTVSSANSGAIDRLEIVGRLIAGTALALAILPILLRRGMRTVPAAIVSIAIIAVAFVGQRTLVDSIANGSDGQARARAVRALTVRDAMQPQSPAERAFVAFSPLAAFVRPDAVREAGGIDDLTFRRARDIIGDEAAFRAGAYSQVTDAARKMFDAYREADRALARSTSDAHAASAAAWTKWSNWLSDHTYGLAMREGIRSSEDVRNYGRIARQQGVPVPEGWYPLDEATFRAAAERAYQEQIAKRAKNSPFAGIRTGILDFAAFVREPTVQEKLRAVAGPVAIALTGSDATPAAFRDTAWKPAVVAVQNRIKDQTVAFPSRFADGGDLAEIGRNAMRSVSVPPIALALSIAGLALHLFKFFNYMLAIFVRRGPLAIAPARLAVVASVLLAAIGILRDGSLPTTHTASWSASEAAIAANYGVAAAHGATLVIDMQPATYGVSARLASLPHFSTIAAWVNGSPHAAPEPVIVAEAR